LLFLFPHYRCVDTAHTLIVPWHITSSSCGLSAGSSTNL